MVIADTQLADGSDHARRQVTVGLPCRNLEVAGQHSSGKRDNNFVAFHEVVGATNDALHAGRIDSLASQGLLLPFRDNTDWHQLMVLPLDCGSLTGLSTAHHNGTREFIRGTVDFFFFKTDLDQSAMTSSAVASAGTCANSRSRKVGYALLDLHPEVLAETYIALDHVAHIADLVAEHERALDAHAEGKT